MTSPLTPLIPRTVSNLTKRFADRLSRVISPPMVVFEVHLAYDRTDHVWYVAESDIPTLFARAADPQELISSVQESTREFFELEGESAINAMAPAPRGIPIAIRPVFDSPLQLAGVRR